jgi:predicted transcriptional regulator
MRIEGGGRGRSPASNVEEEQGPPETRFCCFVLHETMKCISSQFLDFTGRRQTSRGHAAQRLCFQAMEGNEPIVAITVRLSQDVHRALQRLAQQEHRSLAGQAAYLLEQALAVEQRVRRVMAAERAQHWLEQTRTLPGDDAAANPGDAGAGPAAETDEAGGAGARDPR